MAKKQKKKRSFLWFLLGMVIYAVVFLAAVNFGLKAFWNYMEAYENSRPKIAINAYMDGLTEEHICDLSQDLIDQVDHNVQSVEQCRTYIMDAIDGINYAKKSSECTDTRQVFVLRTGKTVIGEFSIIAQEADEYGFTPWAVEGESFDVSVLNLFGSDYEVTVPYDHTVTVNGTVLDESYVTNEKIIYEEIEDYYEKYDLPYRVTYAVQPIMGEMNVVITDPAGNEVTFDENTDWTQYFHNCSDDETAALDDFTAKYVDRYVAFTGSTRKNRKTNYGKLIDYVVEGSDFASRLYNAIEGLEFGQSQGDKVISLVANHQVRLEEGRYLCDITYEVDTTGKKGVVRTTTNAKLIVVQSTDGLRVESMNIY